MTALRTVWLLAWPDGRVHASPGTAAPPKWADLVTSDGCLVSEVPSVPFPDPPQPARTPVKTAA